MLNYTNSTPVNSCFENATSISSRTTMEIPRPIEIVREGPQMKSCHRREDCAARECLPTASTADLHSRDSRCEVMGVRAIWDSKDQGWFIENEAAVIFRVCLSTVMTL